MNIIKSPDTATLTERDVNDAIFQYIFTRTGRDSARIVDAKVFDCTTLGAPDSKLLTLTVTLKDSK